MQGRYFPAFQVAYDCKLGTPNLDDCHRAILLALNYRIQNPERGGIDARKNVASIILSDGHGRMVEVSGFSTGSRMNGHSEKVALDACIQAGIREGLLNENTSYPRGNLDYFLSYKSQIENLHLTLFTERAPCLDLAYKSEKFSCDELLRELLDPSNGRHKVYYAILEGSSDEEYITLMSVLPLAKSSAKLSQNPGLPLLTRHIPREMARSWEQSNPISLYEHDSDKQRTAWIQHNLNEMKLAQQASPLAVVPRPILSKRSSIGAEALGTEQLGELVQDVSLPIAQPTLAGSKTASRTLEPRHDFQQKNKKLKLNITSSDTSVQRSVSSPLAITPGISSSTQVSNMPGEFLTSPIPQQPLPVNKATAPTLQAPRSRLKLRKTSSVQVQNPVVPPSITNAFTLHQEESAPLKSQVVTKEETQKKEGPTHPKPGN